METKYVLILVALLVHCGCTSAELEPAVQAISFVEFYPKRSFTPDPMRRGTHLSPQCNAMDTATHPA